jgi:hypothetical protein
VGLFVAEPVKDRQGFAPASAGALGPARGELSVAEMGEHLGLNVFS